MIDFWKLNLNNYATIIAWKPNYYIQEGVSSSSIDFLHPAPLIIHFPFYFLITNF